MTAVRARLMGRLLGASCALVLGATALLAGCSTHSNVSFGTAVVTMSDVSGDFSSYTVDVDSITLTRNDGVIVEPLSTPQVVDLVKLHDLTELVETPAVPVGTYTTLSLTLDYSVADITVNINGVPTAVAAYDTSGNVMSISTLTVTFDPNNPLVINPGVSTRLHIDVNLAASNTINLSASPVTVSVQPFMSATVAPVDQTVMRARGIFVISQPQSNDYIINMRPFVDLSSALGALQVNTTNSTYFNINGIAYTGAAGLTAMQKLQISTPIAAYGTLGSLAAITPTFNATEVYAGSSLETPLADFLTGTVRAVSGDTFTLAGASCVSRLGSPGYVASVPVTVSSLTLVNQDGVAANSSLSTQAISVGQRITVGGQANTNPYCVGTVSLAVDATVGLVRLQPTPVWGTLNSAVPGSLSLNVLSIDNFDPGVFNFAGTGTDAANDAVAASYAINTGAIDASATAPGTLVQTVGLVTPFGSAPPDFNASSVTPGTSTPQTLVVEWGNGGAASPFSSLSSTGLVVDLTNANLSGTIRYIATGPTKTDITTLPASPNILFATGAPLLTLTLGNTTALDVFNGASAFATKLSSTLNGTNLVYRLVCVGQYDAPTNTFTATEVSVNLQE